VKVAIVGSRSYARLERVRESVRSLPSHTIVVSGGARGVDRTAAETARTCGLQVIEFLPDWNRYGKSAGFRRNEQIVSEAERVVAFWDGRSRGTQHSIQLARDLGKPVEIVGNQ